MNERQKTSKVREDSISGARRRRSSTTGLYERASGGVPIERAATFRRPPRRIADASTPTQYRLFTRSRPGFVTNSDLTNPHVDPGKSIGFGTSTAPKLETDRPETFDTPHALCEVGLDSQLIRAMMYLTNSTDSRAPWEVTMSCV